jgi:hypothetical protein
MRAALLLEIEGMEYRLANRKARLHALETGEYRYNGKPCKYGHGGMRYTATDVCVICAKVRRCLVYI